MQNRNYCDHNKDQDKGRYNEDAIHGTFQQPLEECKIDVQLNIPTCRLYIPVHVDLEVGGHLY